ncbi:MAG TPA: CbiX/SirB N-terminal domain-containing protein [Gemmatimonadaceae bacterium]|nr:CbiX/SirB N-terminal domain-containing protein [Gemmatimonadaceae bacterium]
MIHSARQTAARVGATLALLLAVAPAVHAQATPPHPAGATGTIILAHGGSDEWNGYVLDIARSANTGGPIEVSFLMGPAAASHRFQDAVGKLESQGVQRIVVVPMLVSSHSGHYEQIRWLAGITDSLDATMHHHLAMAGIERANPHVPVVVTPAMDDAPEVARVLADRALALATAPTEQAAVLVGHGPNSAENYADWMANLRPVADSVKLATGFRDVLVELVRDDAPAPVRAEAVTRTRELISLLARLTNRDVVVVPVLVSKGRVSREKFMADLEGLPVVYAGDPLLPHPELTRWVERRVSDAAHAASLSRNPAPDSSRAANASAPRSK